MLVKKISLHSFNNNQKSEKQNKTTSFTGKNYGDIVFSDWFVNEVKQLIPLSDKTFENVVNTKVGLYTSYLRQKAVFDWGILGNLKILSDKTDVRKSDYLDLRKYIKMGITPGEVKTNFDMPIGKYSSNRDYLSKNLSQINLHGNSGEYNPLING